VIAYGNASVAFAATLAPKVGIVNFIEELQPQLRRNMNLYGFGELVGPSSLLAGTSMTSSAPTPAPPR